MMMTIDSVTMIMMIMMKMMMMQQMKVMMMKMVMMMQCCLLLMNRSWKSPWQVIDDSCCHHRTGRIACWTMIACVDCCGS